MIMISLLYYYYYFFLKKAEKEKKEKKRKRALPHIISFGVHHGAGLGGGRRRKWCLFVRPRHGLRGLWIYDGGGGRGRGWGTGSGVFLVGGCGRGLVSGSGSGMVRVCVMLLLEIYGWYGGSGGDGARCVEIYCLGLSLAPCLWSLWI